MKNTDTRAAVLAERSADPEATGTEIARRLGVSKQRVHQILKGMGLTFPGPTGSALDHRVEYKCWHNMIARCIDPDHKTFRHYGARGIAVCGRWLNSFPSFLADMGPRPSPGHSIDRINNDGNYEPGNCRWGTRSQQSGNRRKKLTDAMLATIRKQLREENPTTGKLRYTVKEIAKMNGISASTINTDPALRGLRTQWGISRRGRPPGKRTK